MAPNNESSRAANKSRRIWEGNENLNDRCISLFVDAINKGGRSGSTLKKEHWAKIASQLNDEFQKGLDTKAVRNHWDNLKTKFQIWKYLKNLTGHAFNPTTGLFDFPPDKWEEIIQSKPRAKEFKKKPLTNLDELSYIFDPTESPGIHSHCSNEEGAPPRREFNPLPVNPQPDESMDEDEIENIGVTQNPMPDSYWEHLTFDFANIQTETPSPSPSPSSSTGTNRKRKGPATTNMEALVGIIEGGFSYFQAESDALKAERQADRLERQAQWNASEVERNEKRAERNEIKAIRDRVMAEEEACSVSEVTKALMEMFELNVITMPFIQRVSPTICGKLEYRKAFLGAANINDKMFFLQMMSGVEREQ